MGEDGAKTTRTVKISWRIAVAMILINYSNQREPSKLKETLEDWSNDMGARGHSPHKERFELPSSPKSCRYKCKQKMTKSDQFANTKHFLCN